MLQKYSSLIHLKCHAARRIYSTAYAERMLFRDVSTPAQQALTSFYNTRFPENSPLGKYGPTFGMIFSAEEYRDGEYRSASGTHLRVYFPTNELPEISIAAIEGSGAAYAWKVRTTNNAYTAIVSSEYDFSVDVEETIRKAIGTLDEILDVIDRIVAEAKYQVTQYPEVSGMSRENCVNYLELCRPLAAYYLLDRNYPSLERALTHYSDQEKLRGLIVRIYNIANDRGKSNMRDWFQGRLDLETLAAAA